ncbi:MAG: cytochrome c [Planctomycetota bacterium]
MAPTVNTLGSKLAAALLVGLAGAVTVGGLAGCRGDRSDSTPRRFFPDMDDQQKWDPQEETEFFADGRTARPQPANTVAFSALKFDPEASANEPWASEFLVERSMLLAEDDATFTGGVGPMNDESRWVAYSPVAITSEMVLEGQKQFNIYCAACHGYLADAKGMVGQRWSYPPANLLGGAYTDRTQKQGTDGWLYHVIREGVWATDGANRMPGYKHAVDPMEAWSIVGYLRALQRSQNATPADLTPAERDQLAASLPASPDTIAQTANDGGDS